MATDSVGHPFLAFVNTVRDDGKTRTSNSFADAAELLDVLLTEGLVARGEPLPMRTQLSEILALREASYEVLSAMAAGRVARRDDAAYVEAAIKRVVQEADLIFSPAGLSFEPRPNGSVHDKLVLALYGLLQTQDIHRLTECKRCTHLFLDHGRGRGRRWCSMSRCGNRVKAETFRSRKKAERL